MDGKTEPHVGHYVYAWNCYFVASDWVLTSAGVECVRAHLTLPSLGALSVGGVVLVHGCWGGPIGKIDGF